MQTRMKTEFPFHGCHGNKERPIFQILVSKHHQKYFSESHKVLRKIFCRSGDMLERPQKGRGNMTGTSIKKNTCLRRG